MKYFLPIMFFGLSYICLGNTMETLNSERSTIKIHGTSSLHDWTMDATEFSIDFDSTTEDMTHITVKVPVSKIQSDSDMMNDKTHSALKERQHPEIRFTAKNIKMTADEIEIPGQLSMAGMSKSITLHKVKHKLDKNIRILSGETDIDMTEFQIKPPSVLFMTVGKTVKVSFHIELQSTAK
ncbi:MAG: YceI family protein [Oligoflexus sp.]